MTTEKIVLVILGAVVTAICTILVVVVKHKLGQATLRDAEKYALAMKTLKMFHDCRRRFWDARRCADGPAERYKTEHSAAFDELEDLGHEFKAMFGPDDSEPFDAMKSAADEFVRAADMLEFPAEFRKALGPETRRKYTLIVHAGLGASDADEFAQKLDSIIERMDGICGRYIAG